MWRLMALCVTHKSLAAMVKAWCLAAAWKAFSSEMVGQSLRIAAYEYWSWSGEILGIAARPDWHDKCNMFGRWRWVYPGKTPEHPAGRQSSRPRCCARSHE